MMLKKCLIAMMLATAFVVVIPASMATAASNSDATVATPQNLDSIQFRVIGGNLNLWGEEVKAIAAPGLGRQEGDLVAAPCPASVKPRFTQFPAPPVSRAIGLIRLICKNVGESTGNVIVGHIRRMNTLAIRDNQCFQFKFRLRPQGGPVTVNPIGNCQ